MPKAPPSQHLLQGPNMSPQLGVLQSQRELIHRALPLVTHRLFGPLLGRHPVQIALLSTTPKTVILCSTLCFLSGSKKGVVAVTDFSECFEAFERILLVLVDVFDDFMQGLLVQRRSLTPQLVHLILLEGVGSPPARRPGTAATTTRNTTASLRLLDGLLETNRRFALAKLSLPITFFNGNVPEQIGEQGVERKGVVARGGEDWVLGGSEDGASPDFCEESVPIADC
jgi:hypothetical protein